MYSRWNDNLKIFAMMLVSTYSNSHIKIRVFGPTQDWFQVKLGQSCLKISEKLEFFESLDLAWPSIEPRADQGHFGHFRWRRHFECSDVRTSCVPSSLVSSRPYEEKMIFLDFLGSNTQIEVEKIWYQQLPLLYLIPRVQWVVSDRQHDLIFCCP